MDRRQTMKAIGAVLIGGGASLSAYGHANTRASLPEAHRIVESFVNLDYLGHRLVSNKTSPINSLYAKPTGLVNDTITIVRDYEVCNIKEENEHIEVTVLFSPLARLDGSNFVFHRNRESKNTSILVLNVVETKFGLKIEQSSIPIHVSLNSAINHLEKLSKYNSRWKSSLSFLSSLT